MQPKTPKRKSMKKEVETPKKAESPAVIKNGTPKIKTPKKENDAVANDSKSNGKAKKRSASLSMKNEGTPSPKKSKKEVSPSKKPKQEVSPSKKSKQEVSSPEDKEVKTKSRRHRPKSKLQNHIKTALRTNDVSTLTITPDNLKERIASMQSNDALSKTAKRKLAMYTKLYQMMTGEARPNKKGKPVKVKSNQNVEVKGSKKAKQNKKPAKVEVEEESDEEMSEEVTEENSDEDSDELEEASDDDDLEEESEDDDSEDEEVEMKKPAKQKNKAQPEVDSDLSEDDDEEASKESEESDEEPKVAKKPAKKEQKNQNQAKQGTKHVAFVGSLPFSMKLDEVREFLGNYDGVVFVEVPPHEESGKHKGFAFVHFKDEKSYKNLISQSGSLVIQDRKIVVKPRNQKSEPGQKKNFQHNKKAKRAT